MLFIFLLLLGHLLMPGYEQMPFAELGEIKKTILECHRSHPEDLGANLETDGALRARFISAHLALSRLSQQLPAGSKKRKGLHKLCRDLVSGTRLPGNRCYARNWPIEAKQAPTLALLRERLYRTWMDALPTTPRMRKEMARIACFSKRHAELFEKHEVLVMDSGKLQDDQLQAVDDLLTLIPSEMHDLRAIGVVEFLGEFPEEISWGAFFAGAGGEINIFGALLEEAEENPFPSEVAPSQAPTFVTCLAHEVNHIVDAYCIAGDVRLRGRKDRLIAAAGACSANYLRSMLADGFFRDHPQEFFASISNQWCVDSAKTIHLGILRLRAGNGAPLDQAMFFAEVYGQAGKHTLLFRTSEAGSITRFEAPMRRNAAGRPTLLTFDGMEYTFTYDSKDQVRDYQVRPAARTWSLPDGKRIEACLTQRKADVVELRTKIRKRIHLPRSSLSEEDREYLELLTMLEQ